MKKIIILGIITFAISQFSELSLAEEKLENGNLIINDKNGNTIIIGGIDDNDKNNENKSGINKETVIKDMLIINNGKEIYISDNKNDDEK